MRRRLAGSSWAWVGGVCVLYALLASRTLFDPAVGFPDADRILMDGVFIRDFILAFPIFSPLDFALRYFAQYPALSLGYRPPLLPMLEAAFMVPLGVEIWAARLAVIASGVVALAVWFRLVAGVFDRITAAAACAMLASLPFITHWSSYTMAEVPTMAMAMLSAACFHWFIERRRARYAYLAALAFAAAVWSKQTAVFLPLWLLPYALLRWRWRDLLGNRHVWAAVALALVLIAPILAVTLYLGDQQIAQSLGEGERAAGRWAWAKWTYYPKALVDQHLTVPVAVLALIGLAWAAWRRDGRAVFFVLALPAVYVFFSLLAHPGLARYAIFWIPSLTVLAALPVHYAQGLRPATAVALVAVAAAVGFNTWSAWLWTPRYVTSFDQAARMAVSESRSRAIMIHSRNNGYFTFFVRQADPAQKLFVLRSDKLFTSSSIGAKNRLRVYADDAEAFRGIIEGFGVDLVVADSEDFTGVAAQQSFLKYLQSSADFERLSSIPILSNTSYYGGRSIDIYRFVAGGDGASRPDLVLELPVIGKRLVVPAEGEAYYETLR